MTNIFEELEKVEYDDEFGEVKRIISLCREELKKRSFVSCCGGKYGVDKVIKLSDIDSVLGDAKNDN